MRIAAGTLVGLEYVMRLEDGQLLDASSPNAPLTYLHGRGQILPGLERALEGLERGDRRRVVLSPREAFGERDPAGVEAMPRSAFPQDVPLSAGQELLLEGPDGGAVPFSILSVKDDEVLVDLNHPLAGKRIEIDLTVRDVRPGGERLDWIGEVDAPAHP